MPLIPYKLSLIRPPKLSDNLGMAQVELVSMVIVNNGLLPVERHDLQDITKKVS